MKQLFLSFFLDMEAGQNEILSYMELINLKRDLQGVGFFENLYLENLIEQAELRIGRLLEGEKENKV